MNDSFRKLACLAIAAVGTQLYGALPTKQAECKTDACVYFSRGEPLADCQNCPAAYNIPASILIQNECSWMNNWSVDLSATYWRIDQEGLNLASSAAYLSSDSDQLIDGTFFQQPFKYQPGFKVGIGMRADDWTLFTEYTWVRDSVSRNGNAPAIASAIGTAIWDGSPWFLQTGLHGDLAASNIGSKWKLGIDLLDGGFSRPYYLGKNLTVSPFAGIRAAWFRQSLVVTMTAIGDNFSSEVAQTITSTNRSHNWGIGPRMGSAAQCLFPMGFRTQGDIAVSLLYTKFTRINHKEQNGTPGYPPVIRANQYNLNTMRPGLEMGLGLGWGTYSYCNKYHFDLSADYDFMLYPNQNMMKTNLDAFQNGAAPAYDLHMHGVTITAKVDF